MILLSVYTDPKGKYHRGGNCVVIFDHIQLIEYDESDHSLDIAVAGNPNLLRLYVSDQATERAVMAKFWLAMQPAFDGRTSSVEAVKVTLDLRGI